MADKSALGNRMKGYEEVTAGVRHLPLLPVIARLDGKRFSRFTEGLRRPYDPRLSELMMRTTEHLVEQTQARVGYTQSDEISLLYYSDDLKRQPFLDGRVHKQVSVLASMVTAFFARTLDVMIPEKSGSIVLFDCRVWTLPNRDEAANALLWRERDATKNSIGMAARHYYSHEQLLNRTSSELHDLLHAKGVNWNDYPRFFKRGTYVQRRPVTRRFTADELRDLPAEHRAHSEPELMFERRETVRLQLPRLGSVSNRVQVLFDGADPAF
ncbi:MAG: tRNA(His) guanylyltransferase [Kiritimatiellia bacterium]|jgi:tRNA(His) guanylyltransferase